MIENTTLLWTGSVALITLLVGVFASKRDYEMGQGSFVGVVSFTLSLLFWLLFTYHSTGYVQSLGDTAQQTSTQSMTVVGLIAAVLSLMLLFDGALRTLR